MNPRLLSVSLYLMIIASPSMAQKPTVNVSKMNITDVFQQTLKSVPDCIEYCVDGMSLYAIIKPWGVSYYWTPNISHNSPDLLMMAYNDLRDSPWHEFDAIFGEAYAKFTEKLLQSFTNIDVEVGGGRERHQNWGRHQSVAFKEAAGIGHPASLILKMFDKNGLKSKYKKGKVKQQQTNRSAANDYSMYDWLNLFYHGNPMPITPTMLKGVGSNHANMEAIAKDSQLSTLVDVISKAVVVFGGTGQRLFCPIKVTPNMPYYLSGLDSLEWRMGYPISDFRYSDKILNPLKNEGIGTKVQDSLHLDALRFKQPMMTESWGNLYPREGTLDHPWDSKLATVITARAGSILVEDSQSTRIRHKPDRSNHGFGGWGKIFPIIGETTPGQKSAACHKNIANTGITINETGGYAWTFWRRYNCDMRNKGVHVTTVKFPKPICLTTKVPE